MWHTNPLGIWVGWTQKTPPAPFTPRPPAGISKETWGSRWLSLLEDRRTLWPSQANDFPPKGCCGGRKKTLERLDRSSVGIREAAMLCHLFVSARAFPYVICHRFTKLSGTLDFGGKETQGWTETQTSQKEWETERGRREEGKKKTWRKEINCWASNCVLFNELISILNQKAFPQKLRENIFNAFRAVLNIVFRGRSFLSWNTEPWQNKIFN